MQLDIGEVSVRRLRVEVAVADPLAVTSPRSRRSLMVTTSLSAIARVSTRSVREVGEARRYAIAAWLGIRVRSADPRRFAPRC